MRILVVGTGGVGSAFAEIAKRRSFFEHCALADYDPARPERLVAVEYGAPHGVLELQAVDYFPPRSSSKQ